jgi:predicted secreted hydrolase
MSKDVFTLTSPDGKQTTLPVRHGSLGPDVVDIGQLYKEQGVFTFDPGYVSTGSCKSGDWFSIQLDDGSELMLFQLRRSDGGISPYSSGTLIEPDGSAVHLSLEEFSITVNRLWTSPHSGAEYPAGWTIEIPSLDIQLEIEPYVADQELSVSFVYWEGASSAGGTRAGAPVSGSGYVELTGYAHSMQGEF